MSVSKRLLMAVGAVALAAAAVGGYIFWLDNEFYWAKLTRSNRLPVAKIGSEVFYESDLYDAIDTARQFGVPAEQVLDQFVAAHKTLIAGRSSRLFPRESQIEDAARELFKPSLGGVPLPEGSPVPLIFREESDWKTLQAKAGATRRLAEESGTKDALERAERKLRVRIYMKPLSAYPEGR